MYVQAGSHLLGRERQLLFVDKLCNTFRSTKYLVKEILSDTTLLEYLSRNGKLLNKNLIYIEPSNYQLIRLIHKIKMFENKVRLKIPLLKTHTDYYAR
jgi:hypothetical protein